MKNNVKSEVMMHHVEQFLTDQHGDSFSETVRYAQQNGVPSVAPLTGELLRLLVRMNRPAKVLELGCGIGLSTQYLLDSDIQHLDSVDLNKDRIKKASEFVTDDRVTFHTGHVHTYLKNCQQTYDFVFVDTVKREYLSVWYLLKPLLNDRAVLVFDDVLLYGYVANEICEIPKKYHNGVTELKQFFDTIYNDENVTAYTMPVADGISVVQYER